MLILLKCPLVEGELRGGSMGGGRLEVVSPLARVGVPDSRRMIVAVYSDVGNRLLLVRIPAGEWVSGWLAGWLDHPPCGSLK